jgi:hypothetical protein
MKSIVNVTLIPLLLKVSANDFGLSWQTKRIPIQTNLIQILLSQFKLKIRIFYFQNPNHWWTIGFMLLGHGTLYYYFEKAKANMYFKNTR